MEESGQGAEGGGLGESGVGDAVPHWVPGADGEASFRGERSEGLVESSGVGGVGGTQMGCSFRSFGSGASQTRPSSPGTSLLTSARTPNLRGLARFTSGLQMPSKQPPRKRARAAGSPPAPVMRGLSAHSLCTLAPHPARPEDSAGGIRVQRAPRAPAVQGNQLF